MNVHSTMSKRQQILNTFLEITSREGFSDSSIRDIAGKAGIAVGSVYTYFSNKDELIHTLFSELQQERADAVMKDHSENESAEVQLKKYWENLFNYYISKPFAFYYLEQFNHSPLYNEEEREQKLKILDPVITSFERGIAKGGLRYMNPTAMLYILYGHAAAIARLHLAGKVNVIDYQMEVLKQSFWDSLRAMKY